MVSPARRFTVDALMGELAQLEPLDDGIEADIAGALALITPEVQDPWAEG